jgi:hypothetical protein
MKFFNLCPHALEMFGLRKWVKGYFPQNPQKKKPSGFKGSAIEQRLSK